MKKTKNKTIAFTLPSHLPGMGGWGNGYVAIPADNKLFGKHYDNINVNIHGGLTFSEDAIIGQPEETKGMWIVGFDTLHLGDDSQRWPDQETVMAEALELKKQIDKKR